MVSARSDHGGPRRAASSFGIAASSSSLAPSPPGFAGSPPGRPLILARLWDLVQPAWLQLERDVPDAVCTGHHLNLVENGLMVRRVVDDSVPAQCHEAAG